MSIGTTQHLTSAQDVLSARAAQAARAGTEWGLHQAFKGPWTSCSGASQTLDLTAETGFRVTVSCQSTEYSEGETAPGVERKVRIFRISAVACPAASCPSADPATVAGVGYVERTRTVIATN